MKYLVILSLVILTFTACKKVATDPNLLIVEPPNERLLSADTTTSGQKFGLAIGTPSAGIYTVLQSKNLDNLGVVGNVFTSLDSLASRLTLYTGVLLDEQSGTSTGIQIQFVANKVASIYTNDGKALTGWPGITSNNNSVGINDAIGDVYQKLVNIKQMAAYANKFQRISIYTKDVAKAYDPIMGNSVQWYYGIQIDAKTVNRVFLNFKAGKLVSIYSYVYQKN